jgi:hypothetical protein
VDLTIDARWQSEPTGGFNDQGILIEQDTDNWLRFDVFHTGASLRAFMGKTIGGNHTTLLNANIFVGSARSMRVSRAGNTWTMALSDDGVAFTQVGQFTQVLGVTKAGVFAANPVNAWDWTSQVDWFFDAASPIEAEDEGTLSVVADVVGSGTVDAAPDLPVYECDDVVELTASPAPGWIFESWAGDLSGTNNPESLTVVGEMHVTATFVPDPTSVEAIDSVPAALGFAGARPNPFASFTEIAFDLPGEAHVDVTIYDVGGRLVRRLVRAEPLSAGRRTVVWDGRGASGASAVPGVYFCTVSAGGASVTGRLLRLR